jgi:multiple sugar transport system ATP-binding protein
VAVLRGGAVQQVGTPRELYKTPANLFVAGFIGSPAMSFLPGEVEGARLRLPMLELELPRPPGGGRRRVLAGVRPEHFGEAGGDENDRPAFEVGVEMVEWLGADQFVHFDQPVGSTAGLEALPAELDLEQPRDGSLRLVARIDSARELAEGDRLGLTLDAGRIVLFDPRSGTRLESAP